MTSKRNIFIGAAWPYANGPLHLGHAAALLPADILARYHRLKGDNVLLVSGSDCHGTPILIEALEQGVSPKEIAEKYDKEFRRDLIEKLGFSYDFYSKTTSPEHVKVVQEIFLNLLGKKLIYEKVQELPFCKQCNHFLPDRYTEGKCPECDFENARGDQCDNCGSLLNPEDLLNPRCKICGQIPEWRNSKHLFFKLSEFENKLRDWIEPQTHWRPGAYQFTLNILESGLKDRPITRDIEWGVEIPLKGYENKRIYVWFDAVCGYFSATKEWAGNVGKKEKWQEFWEEKCYHYYAHGKDNIVFHTIIWPAILMGLGGLNLPDHIVSSEFMNLEGKQFSTSRNWAVWIPDFLSKYDVDSLRYYLIVNGPETADASFTWENYRLRNNSELVGNYGNFIHRVLGFVYKRFNGQVPEARSLDAEDKGFLASCRQAFEEVSRAIEECKFRNALRLVFGLAEHGNKYIDTKAPWTKIQTNEDAAKTTLNVCTQVILNLRILASPFLPFSSKRLSDLFNLYADQDKWEFCEIPKGLTFKEPVPLYQRLDKAVIDSEVEKLHQGT
jgi:methionyl-tRNA synthetase